MKMLPMFLALSMLGAAPAQAADPAPARPAEAQQAAAKQTDVRAESDRKTAAPAATSHVELDATQITGNRELPRVLYVVPWKRADLGEMSGKPAKSLLDEVLAPVDREVFRRQNRYHDALQPDTAAGKPAAAGGER